MTEPLRARPPKSGLTVCTPLRAERAAVGGVLVSATVVRTGMGPARARRSAARQLGGDGPLAVLGLAGGVAPQVRPGDIVVASEVRGDGGTVTSPSAPLLAAALRRAGLRVHLGPLFTCEKPVTGDELQRLAVTGVLAVDMETAPLATATRGRPFVAVRAVTDTSASPLLHPGIVRRGASALRALRRVAPVLEQWAAATGAREVLLASPRSFCAGVERAIDIVEGALERYGAPVYVRRQIVHNAHVVAGLEQHGAIFVEELTEVPDGARVIFAAHGVTPQVRAEADARGLSVIDATCPLVAKVHQEVRRHASRGHTVFLIGHGDHEEVIGTVGEAPGQVVVVDGEDDARTVNAPDPERVAYAMQTTLAVDEAERIAGTLRERFPALVAPPGEDICYATSNRQQSVREIARDSDLVLVVGSRNSSNSVRLVEVARRAGAAAHLVDDAGEVDLAWLCGADRVGVTAGASAPPYLVEQLVQCLSGLGPVAVSERRTTREDVRFTLPREVS